MIPRFSPTTSARETALFLWDNLASHSRDNDDVARFEEAFARWVGTRRALFVPSGRIGLASILKALDYAPGSEVILPAFTYFAIPAMVRYLGLKPVYAEIDPATSELDSESVAKVLTPATRAIIPTHLFGRTCDMSGLTSLARARGLDLIEDCAQACGATLGSARAGSRGRAAYFTFGITKNFSTYSGGVVTTSDEELDGRMRRQLAGHAAASRQALLKQGVMAAAMTVATRPALFSLLLGPLLAHARPADADPVQRWFEEQIVPVTDQAIARMAWSPAPAQARAGLRQLAVVDGKNELRRRLGNALLAACARRGLMGLPAPAPAEGDHIFVSFAIRRLERARFGAALRAAGVDFAAGYMTACSRLPELGGAPGLCPAAEALEREIVHLPLYPELSEADMERIAAAVARADGTEGHR